MITTATVGRADRLTALLAADTRFASGAGVEPQLIQLSATAVADAADAVQSALDGSSALLMDPALLTEPVVANGLRARRAPVLLALTGRHERAVQSSLAAVATGRLGLPWNVQADLVLATGAPVGLIGAAVDPLDVVLRTVRLPVTEVVARCHSVPGNAATGEAGHATVQCRHHNGVTSTVVVGVVPEPGNEATDVVRHRYRVSGSHGELVIDATKPALAVRTARGSARRWGAPPAGQLLLDGVVAQLAGGPTLTPPEAVTALADLVEAIQESVASGQPVTVATGR